ncbi:MAG: single-stranded DNA-binding protein [Microcoleus sp.]
MIDLNTVSIVGRAGGDPEPRYFESGNIVVKFNVAVNRPRKDDPPDWFSIEIWGKTAEVAAQYVKKGSLIGITGSLKWDHWKDRNTGGDRSVPVIRCDKLDLLGSKADNQQAQEQF